MSSNNDILFCSKAGELQPVEEVIVAQSSGLLTAPTGDEAKVKKEKASVTGDKGNPYYAAELDKAAGPLKEIVEAQIKKDTGIITGDKGNPYYAAELDKGIFFFDITMIVHNICI